ncbi:MAG: hypothetical protein ACREIP_09220 [Alphaproteobacteria bacterium]
MAAAAVDAVLPWRLSNPGCFPMRYGLTPGIALRPQVRARDAQFLVARVCAVVLGLFAFIALLPASILPNAVPLVVVFGCACATILARVSPTTLHVDLVTPFSVFFAATGMLYIAASMFQVLPVGNLRPVRTDYILRHAYYILPWIPLIAGTTLIFRHALPDITTLARRAALPVLAGLAAADIASGPLFGVPERMAWEGYLPFFDPPVLIFFYAACFFLCVSTTRRAAMPLVVVTSHCLISNAFGFGQMFNTTTGMFVLVCMWIFAIGVRKSPRFAFLCLAALVCGLALVMIAGVAAPRVIGLDINSQWRFFVWRENLFAALGSGSLGVGFGTPYYQLSAGNVADAFRLMNFAEFAQYKFSSPIDLLYIRGQHSSFVNAFYRMGLLGGGLLLAFNAAVVVVLLKALRGRANVFTRVAAGAGAIFLIEAVQLALHVGLESPRYLAVYALAVGLARAAAHLSRREADR